MSHPSEELEIAPGRAIASSEPQPETEPEPALSDRPTRNLGAKLLRVAAFLQVRMRFILVAVLLFLVLGQWDRLENWVRHLVRLASGGARVEQGVSPDTEYFCPMCPGVLSAWPEKCPVCNMPLVRRQSGEATLLPEGVTARMQLSPDRIQLAGIRTEAVEHRELLLNIEAAGLVVHDPAGIAVVTAPADGTLVEVAKDLEWKTVEEGQRLAILQPHLSQQAGAGESAELPILSPAPGRLVELTGSPARKVARGEVLAVVADDSRLAVEVIVSEKEAGLIGVGDEGQARCRALPTRGPWRVQVTAVSPEIEPGVRGVAVRLSIESPAGDLPIGSLVEVALSARLADIEPFRSLPKELPALTRNEPRKVLVCPVHSDVVATTSGACPLDGVSLVERVLGEFERLRWWCPAHPEVNSARDGASCDQCQGMKLSPRIVTYSPPGKVLAVPRSAVVDSGSMQVVYVEHGPGMFDGVEVKLGPLAGDYYPVIAGLKVGDRVASSGAFLLDAETRLNPHLAAAYFGAAGDESAAGSTTAAPSGSAGASAGASDGGVDASLRKLGEADRALAMRQRICPVTKLPLGSMGVPVRVESRGKVAFLCCEGCRAKFLKSSAGKSRDD